LIASADARCICGSESGDAPDRSDHCKARADRCSGAAFPSSRISARGGSVMRLGQPIKSSRFFFLRVVLHGIRMACAGIARHPGAIRRDDVYLMATYGNRFWSRVRSALRSVLSRLSRGRVQIDDAVASVRTLGLEHVNDFAVGCGLNGPGIPRCVVSNGGGVEMEIPIRKALR